MDKDLIFAIASYLVAYFSLKIAPNFKLIYRWIFKFGCWGGTLVMLIYFLRLRIRAQGIDPDSKEAFREYLKLGSLISFIIFITELPMMLASL